MIEIKAVVEGDGEVTALPVLLQRLKERLAPTAHLLVKPPWRTSADKHFRGNWSVFERASGMARGEPSPTGLLLVLDTDLRADRCPRKFAAAMLRQARLRAVGLPVGLVLANSEFETWFVAAADSLRGICELSADLATPPAPEAIAGAKAWLRRHMPPGRRYRETIDQKIMAGQFDLDQARHNSPSFDKFWREIQRLLGELLALEAGR